MLSLDRKICEKNSAVQRRLVALAEAVGNTPPADLPAEASAQAGIRAAEFSIHMLRAFVITVSNGGRMQTLH